MTTQQTDLYSQAADWLVGAARRKPEALLLFAAGCALMMRGTGKGAAARQPGDVYGQAPWRDEASRSAPAAAGLGKAAEKVSQYAGEVRDRLGDKADTYASSVSDYADDARRRVGDYAEGLRQNVSAASDQVASTARSAVQTTSDTLREQPLLIAALGLAAGAAVAALFPTSDVERRTLGPAGDALAGAAGRAGEDLMDRAVRTGEQVQKSAAERGLSSEGLKDMAHQAAETFTRTAPDGAREPRGPTTGSSELPISRSVPR
jgi:ElaB/YqjD/DUF883 family membrane-anchored ribosome-binding protein